MMGYSDESKVCKLFDPAKQQIILRKNVIFYENMSSTKLLNSFSGLLHNDPFDISEEYQLTIASFDF